MNGPMGARETKRARFVTKRVLPLSPFIGPFINCDEWHATREGPSCSFAEGANLLLSSSLRLVPLLPYDSFHIQRQPSQI